MLLLLLLFWLVTGQLYITGLLLSIPFFWTSRVGHFFQFVVCFTRDHHYHDFFFVSLKTIIFHSQSLSCYGWMGSFFLVWKFFSLFVSIILIVFSFLCFGLILTQFTFVYFWFLFFSLEKKVWIKWIHLILWTSGFSFSLLPSFYLYITSKKFFGQNLQIYYYYCQLY